MNRDTILTDVRYAIRQLALARTPNLPASAIADCVQRAADGLERVEWELLGETIIVEVVEPDDACECGRERDREQP